MQVSLNRRNTGFSECLVLRTLRNYHFPVLRSQGHSGQDWHAYAEYNARGERGRP